MPNLPDPRGFPSFVDFYRERFRVLYSTGPKPHTKRAKVDDIAAAEREHRAAWSVKGQHHAG